jgi:hypothetical protein
MIQGEKAGNDLNHPESPRILLKLRELLGLRFALARVVVHHFSWRDVRDESCYRIVQ